MRGPHRRLTFSKQIRIYKEWWNAILSLSETLCAPVHLCWPNESRLTGATYNRTAYDDTGAVCSGLLK